MHWPAEDTPMARFPLCIIGVGPAGRNYLKELRKTWDVDVVGFVNRSPERREAVQRETGVPGFATYRELLAGVATRPRLAVIASANTTHRDFAIEVLESGIDCFCEKPMAMSLADCRAMLEAERRTGRALQIGFEYRYGSMTARLKELQSQGSFGEIRCVEAVDSRGHWWPEHPETPVADVWHLNRAVGGGPLLHCGIHQLDLLRHYAGEVAEVQAFVPPRSLSFYPADIPDHFTLHLRFASGAAGMLSVFHNLGSTWYRPSPSWVPKYHEVPGHFMNLTLTGTGGAAIAELYGEELHLARYDVAQRETIFERTETFHHHHPDRTHHDTSGMIATVARRLAAGQGVLHSAEDSYRTTVLGMRCEEAVQEALASGWTSQRLAVTA